MGRPTPITRIWEIDIKAAEATGRRGVFVARETIETTHDMAAARVAFRAATKLTVSGSELKQVANLSTKYSVDQVRRKLVKRQHEDRFARQFRRSPGGTSVRSVSGGLPTLGGR